MAPASLTGGAGFSFEDRVGAWAGAALLSGASPVGADFGPLRAISFQGSALHEPLDDLVVVSRNQPHRRFTASIKSFDMLRGARLEAGFVADAWRRRLAADFDADDELLGLVSGSTAQGNWRSLVKLTTYAAADEPDRMVARLAEPGAFNKTDRTLWESAALPATVAHELGMTAGFSPAVLLGCVRPLCLDFDVPTSEAAAQALRWCDDALAPGQRLGPSELWHALLDTVAQVRPAGGTLDWPALAERLGQFAFALRPDARHDWALLDEHTASACKSVRSELGTGMRLARTAELGELSESAAGNPVLLLSGPPGCGKSALALAWAAAGDSRALVLRSWDFDGGLAGLRARLGLRSALLDSLRLSELPPRIVIDGLDGGADGAHFAAAAELTRVAAELPGVRVVITCAELALTRVFDQLQAAGAPLASALPLMLGNLSDGDVGEVLEQRDDLRRLAEAGDLRGVLDRPKMLDLVLQTLDRVGPQPLAGAHDETAVAEVWWSRLAVAGQHRAKRGELLTGLAVAHADALRASTSIGALGPLAPFAGVVDELRADGILTSDERRYAFAHELFADWARLQWLRSRGEGLDAMAGRAQLPPWQRAVRLTGLALLREQGAEAWLAARATLAAGPEPLLAELLLDAPLLAADAEETLEGLWPQLAEADGALLDRTLNRFWSVASIPDPRGNRLIGASPHLAAHWAAITRLPLPSLWPPVLRVLARHAGEAAALAPVRVADLVNLWLRTDQSAEPADQDAASMGLALLEWLVARGSGANGEDARELKTWRAALAAGAVHPQHVADTVRAALSDVEQLDDDEPWAAPPRATALRNAVLDGDALVPLAIADARGAADLALACALTPGSSRVPDSWAEVAGELEIAPGPFDLTATPETGPFLRLLDIAPEHGLRVIIDVAEHATACWEAGGGVHRERDTLDGRAFEMLVGGRWKPLVGDADVLQWHRGHATTPALLASALMALERWLYDRLEANQDIDDVLARLLSSSSLALIGVAVEVACLRPELLLGPLAPLTSCAGVLLADRTYTLAEHPDLALAGLHQPAAHARLTLWNAMPHRSLMLDQVLMSYVLNGVGLADELTRAREHWAESDSEGWRFMLAQTDPARYRLQDTPAGSGWRLELPADLQDEVDRDQPELDGAMFWMSFPYQMRGLLDSAPAADGEDPQALWERAQAGLASEPPGDLAQVGVRVREDAACALAAVLIVRHPAWLADHPEQASWCRHELLGALADPPADFVAGVRDTAGDRWDVFCADAVPVLLAGAPGDAELRTALVILITSRRLHRVQVAFRRLGHLPVLADDLGRLEHLSLYVARTLAWQAERDHRERLVEQGFTGPAADDLPDIPAEFDRAANAFVRAELSPTAPLVSEFLAETPESFVRARPGGRHRLALALYPEYLLAANGHRLWLGNISEPDRARRLAFAIDVSGLLAESLGASESGRRNSQQKDGWQQDLLWALGPVTATLPVHEARQLWAPLLALGRAGLDSYLRGLWRQLLSADPTPAGAPALIVELIAACTARHWAPRASSDIVLAVAGIDGFQVGAWADRHAELLAAVCPAWEEWLSPHASSPIIAGALARFAARHAADPARPAILSWLAEVAPKPDRWAERDAALGELMTWLHATDDVLRTVSTEGDYARTILAALTERGHRVAIALSEEPVEPVQAASRPRRYRSSLAGVWGEPDRRELHALDPRRELFDRGRGHSGEQARSHTLRRGGRLAA